MKNFNFLLTLTMMLGQFLLQSYCYADASPECGGGLCKIENSSNNACVAKASPSDATTTANLVDMLSQTSIPWIEYTPGIMDKAENENRTVMVIGISQTCAWSKKMLGTTFKDKKIADILAKDFIPTYFDFDKNQDLAIKYKIISLPTILFLDKSGEIKKEFTGYIPPDKMSIILEDIVNKK